MSARSCERMRSARSSVSADTMPHPPRAGDQRDPDDRHGHGQQAVADRAEVGPGEDEHRRRRRRARHRPPIRTRPSRRSPPASEARDSRRSRSRSSSEACRQISAPPRHASSAGANSPPCGSDVAADPDRRQRRRDGHGVLEPGRQPTAPGLGVGRHDDEVRAVERDAQPTGAASTTNTIRTTRTGTPTWPAMPVATPPSTPRSGRRYRRGGRPAGDGRGAGHRTMIAVPGPCSASGGAPRPGIRVRIRAVPDVPEPRGGARFPP